ncbi:tpr repeat-containing protein [Moniliophthora roreri]|uniref:TPR-like protein n=1 Tax=Moniliophthora roreri TaxID=221103 RepID=A0A0W0FWV8_MONRR|nr:tpr repeat-containing protein [Moniliophthora roreri]
MASSIRLARPVIHNAARLSASRFIHRSWSLPRIEVQSKSLGPTNFKRYATSVTPHSTASDPAEVEALRCLEEGTMKLEEGDVQAAKTLYKRSAEIKRDASSLFNLGVTHYHLKEFDEAIAAWKESITLQPSSPDAHTTQCIASSLSPEDPEIAFNLAAVLEATGRLEEALEHYKRSREFGVERAAMHIRNVSAKILGQRMKDA